MAQEETRIADSRNAFFDPVEAPAWVAVEDMVDDADDAVIEIRIRRNNR